ncbi:MAG: hypothetical protein ACXVEU_03760 [Nocardioidaceae bacterium]
MRKKSLAVAGVTALVSVGMTTAAFGESNIISIKKFAHLSASHRIVFVGARVVCSPDTTSADLSVTLTEVTHGNVQSNTGEVANLNSFECSGNTETVLIPVRRPSGGFNWVRGKARASDLYFTTDDPSGTFTDHASGRTVTVVK